MMSWIQLRRLYCEVGVVFAIQGEIARAMVELPCCGKKGKSRFR